MRSGNLQDHLTEHNVAILPPFSRLPIKQASQWVFTQQPDFVPQHFIENMFITCSSKCPLCNSGHRRKIRTYLAAIDYKFRHVVLTLSPRQWKFLEPVFCLYRWLACRAEISNGQPIYEWRDIGEFPESRNTQIVELNKCYRVYTTSELNKYVLDPSRPRAVVRKNEKFLAETAAGDISNSLTLKTTAISDISAKVTCAKFASPCNTNDLTLNTLHALHATETHKLCSKSSTAHVKPGIAHVRNRACTTRKKRESVCSSKYKGVCFDKKRNRWRATICVARKIQYLGSFKCEEDAAMAYNEAAMKIHGLGVKLNQLPVSGQIKLTGEMKPVE